MAWKQRRCTARLNLIVFVLFWYGCLALHLVPPQTTKDKQPKDINDAGVASSSGYPAVSAMQERLHPGVIASVVIVSLMSIVAGMFIIRKYCCQPSSITYRYSVLRGLEDQNTSSDSIDEHAEDAVQVEESDEDILE